MSQIEEKFEVGELSPLEIIKKELEENPIDAYESLGMSANDLFGISDEEHRDEIVKRNYISRLQEFQKKIRDILDNTEKQYKMRIDQIEALMPEVFKVLSAFAKIKSEDDRCNYADADKFVINTELENLARNLKRTVRIMDGTKAKKRWIGPYQIFAKKVDIEESQKKAVRDKIIRQYAANAVGEGEKDTQENEKLNSEIQREIESEIQRKLDEKVQMFASQHLGFNIIPKGLYKSVEELENMIFQVFKCIWAYSKLKTPKERELFDAENEFVCAKVDSSSEKTALGTIMRAEYSKPEEVVLEINEDGKPKVILSKTAELIEGIVREDGSTFRLPDISEIREYLVTTNEEGESKQDVFYSNIDMKRLEEDPKYRNLIMQRILNPNIRLFSRRHLANYMGEITGAEHLNVIYNPRNSAMCRKYQEQKRTKKQVIHNSNESEVGTISGGDEEPAH